jgi:hypothetical protein
MIDKYGLEFIIRVNGQQVDEHCVEWELVDAEEGASEIKIVIANKDLRFSGQFDYGQDMDIRFGYSGDMSDTAYLPVGEVEEHYPSGKYPTVTVIGRDPTSKMAGGKHRGKHKDGQSQEIIDREVQSLNMKVHGASGQGVSFKNNAYVMNENSLQTIYKMQRTIKPEGSGGNENSPLKGEQQSSVPGTKMDRNDGNSWSSAEKVPENMDGLDENRGKNHNNHHGGEPITADLELKGYPRLKGKTIIEVTGVGSKASGSYYGKQVSHSWNDSNGLRTKAKLIRGGSGKGGAGGEPPVVMYADIWRKNMVYYGPRKISGGPSASFEFGKGDYVIDFKYKCKPQSQRGAGEPGKGKGRGIDLRDEAKAFEKKVQGSGGSGTNAAAAGGAQ